MGRHVVEGTALYPLGQGAPEAPLGTGYPGVLERRLASSFIWYPQPWGLQAEWNWGNGPGLNAGQTAVESRSLEGGYVMALYRLVTPSYGVFIPYTRYQHYHGGYRSLANAPYGRHDEQDFGLEWQIRKGIEVVTELGFVQGISFDTLNHPGTASYLPFHSQILRSQVQLNY
jgi:hypothetical protein